MLEKITRALQAREAIRATDTDALRIVDGDGDGFGDVAIDDFADRWLVETRGKVFPEWVKAAPQPRCIYWKRLGDKESPVWMSGEKSGEPFVARENGVKYWIDFTSGYSQGIFLDQRDNRLALRNMAAGKTVLNTFAYTCAFGVCAALGGASTVNLDLSKRYLDWGRRNYELNGLDPNAPSREHDFIFGDVSDWLRRFAKKGRTFDIIVLDPPTFSRNEKGAIFTIEEGFSDLVAQAMKVLSPRGTLFCSTNQRSINAGDFRRLVTHGIDDLQNCELRAVPMPADFSGEDYLKSLWVERQE